MKFRPIYLWTAGLILAVALAGLAYLGTFTRFHADDFCMAADAAQFGLAGMLVKWYTAWTGRFMFILGTGFFSLGGPTLASWLPALAEAAWLALLSWAILPLIRRAQWPHPRLLAVASSGLALLVLFSATPNLFQSFFWQDGLVNYSLPLIGLTINAGIILRAWTSKSNLLAVVAAVFILAFVCGGFTEAFIAMQVTFFGLALLAVFGIGRQEDSRRLCPILAAALAGSLIAMLIVLAAPGNQVRQGAVGQAPGLVRIITFSLHNAAFIIGKFFIQNPFWSLLAIGVPFLAGWVFSTPGSTQQIHWNPGELWRERWLRGFLSILLAVFILVTAACAPVVYALDAYPDDRAIIIPLFMIVTGGMCASALLGNGLRQGGILPDPLEKPAIGRAIKAGLAAALLAAVAISLFQTVQKVSDFQSYASAWDQRSAYLQQAVKNGRGDVTVVGLNARFGVSDLNADPDNWVNRCMANYYHITSLRGR
ncbi:MAG TPA: DUF6056 family protein [Anaerolineaceae bacterium]